MLVLSRRIGEKTYLDLPSGERITVTLLSVDGNKIREGWNAPKDVKISRDNHEKAGRGRDSGNQ